MTPSVPSPLTREIDAVQNPAFGAALLWRFAAAYATVGKNPESTPLPLLFLPLPLLLYEETRKMIDGTQKASTLRTFAGKFADSKHKESDVLLSFHGRALAHRQLTLESLGLAISARLLQVDPAKGEVFALSTRAPRHGIPSSVMRLLAGAEKLGRWCGEVTPFEVATALHVNF